MPRQKRKQKRKPGIAHVGHTCFHIDFILLWHVFACFFVCGLLWFSYPVTATATAAVTATAAATAVVWGPKSRKRAPAKTL